MSKYIIAVDTICEGIQAIERDEKDNMIIYSTEAEAKAELMYWFNSMNLSRIENGDEPDEEPEEFVMKLEDYVEGHKTIWKGETNEY